ncbi:hypothetical protein [Enterococcus sp. AZ196]|uniref:hypothetical protein n=1 Tax=Enterococcus sp. AZ196 TaxID=2774659 RepID=UPI003D2D70D8
MIKKLVVLGLLLLVVSGCAPEDKEAVEETQKTQKVQKSESKIEKGKVLEVKAENGELFHYTLPKRWQKRQDENSDLFVSSSKEGVSLLIENKADYTDLASYQNAIINTYEDLGDQVVEQGNPVEAQGMSGVELVVASDREGAKIKALIYLLEAEQNYVQVYASTTQSRFDDNREKLKEAASLLKMAEEQPEPV